MIGSRSPPRGENPVRGRKNSAVQFDHWSNPAVAPAAIRANVFELAFARPDRLLGKPEIHVVVEVGRVFRPASDPRDLGVVFGVIEDK